MGHLCSLADVKRALHRDQNDVSIDDALTGALESAEYHVSRYIRQDFRQGAVQNTWTIYDRPEDGLIPMPLEGATVAQLRLYRTPSATPYIAKPLIDYEVQHDGLQPPANLTGTAGGGTGTLTPGTYYYVATAKNGAGETNGSNEVAVTLAAGQTAATLSAETYGGEQYINFYRVTTQGTESTNPTCLVASVQASNLPVQPGSTGGPYTISWVDTGAAPQTGSVPVTNATVVYGARKIRLHPTYFDVPFEGAVSAHMPDNWSRIEVDYIPTGVVPPPVRDATAITAAAIYLRGPMTASGFTMERLGDYMWTTRNFRSAAGSNEVVPEVAKALLRDYKRRGGMTT